MDQDSGGRSTWVQAELTAILHTLPDASPPVAAAPFIPDWWERWQQGAGQHPQAPEEIIGWLKETVAGWNAEPTPFVWEGKRWERRHRPQHRLLGGSAATVQSQLFAA